MARGQSAAGAAPSSANPAGSIRGNVVNHDGIPLTGVQVSLARAGQAAPRKAQTGLEGEFSFPGLAPGAYRLKIAAPSFKTQSVPITLKPGQHVLLPRIVLELTPLVTSITVTPSRAFMAKYQVQQEEQQLVLGFVPNYYVTYFHNTAPLSVKQKFGLAWKSTFNPFLFGLTAAIAGGEEGVGMYSGYGSGAQGYAKRYGAAYANVAISTFVGDALLPSVLKQDPRYYYKGSGSFGARFRYAMTRVVLCKGDNGRWQVDYSGLLGHFVSAGLSNLYYPSQNRNGAGLTLENAGIGIGVHAAINLLQEFVLPKFTPSLARRQNRH